MVFEREAACFLCRFFAMFCHGCGAECASSAKFCHQCGQSLVSVDKLVTVFFHRGYPYDAIVALLERDGVRMHVRTLKRRLKELGLKRKGANFDEALIRDKITQEMEGAGSLSGYRHIWHALRLKHHLHVPRTLVANIMKEIDPEGVEERRSRRLKRRTYVSEGPNFCWHIDGGYNYFIRL